MQRVEQVLGMSYSSFGFFEPIFGTAFRGPNWNYELAWPSPSKDCNDFHQNCEIKAKWWQRFCRDCPFRLWDVGGRFAGPSFSEAHRHTHPGVIGPVKTLTQGSTEEPRILHSSQHALTVPLMLLACETMVKFTQKVKYRFPHQFFLIASNKWLKHFRWGTLIIWVGTLGLRHCRARRPPDLIVTCVQWYKVYFRLDQLWTNLNCMAAHRYAGDMAATTNLSNHLLSSLQKYYSNSIAVQTNRLFRKTVSGYLM